MNDLADSIGDEIPSGDPDRQQIAVDSHDAGSSEQSRGNGQDSRAGSEIHDRPDVLACEQMFQGQQATSCGGVKT